MDVSLDMEPTIRQWISPRLIEANHILSLSLADLEETVQAELEANPALDVDDEATCPRCGTKLDGQYCATPTSTRRPAARCRWTRTWASATPPRPRPAPTTTTSTR